MMRFLIFFLSAFLLGIVQSTLVSLVFPDWLKPDLMLLLVAFLGTSFPLLAGSFLALFCGLLYDSFSGGVFGLFAFVYLTVFFSLKVLARFLILGDAMFIRIILVGGLVFLQTFVMVLLPLAMGNGLRLDWPLPGWILPQLLMTCAACWPLFLLFRKLDVPPVEETSS